jgi:hypothetical protein
MSRVKPITELSSENEHNLNTVKRLKQELKEVTEDRDKYKQIFEETASLLVNNRTNLYSPKELLDLWDKLRTKYSK